MSFSIEKKICFRSNLEDDLQYTSDEDEDGDGDEEDEEWLEVDDQNISVQARNLSEDQEVS